MICLVPKPKAKLLTILSSCGSVGTASDCSGHSLDNQRELAQVEHARKAPRTKSRQRAMYLPDLFRVEDVPRMHALMRARPFAALVSAASSGLFASHLPTVLKDEGPYGVIECHL